MPQLNEKLAVIIFKYIPFQNDDYSKDIYSCQIKVNSGITNKARFHYLNGFKGHQEGTYLYKTISLTKININILSENT